MPSASMWLYYYSLSLDFHVWVHFAWLNFFFSCYGLETACEVVNCTLEECPEGMIYDPGFVTPGECCPSGGTCICDHSQCEVCPPGIESAVVVPANETAGQCCDVIKCKTGEHHNLYNAKQILLDAELYFTATISNAIANRVNFSYMHFVFLTSVLKSHTQQFMPNTYSFPVKISPVIMDCILTGRL